MKHSHKCGEVGKHQVSEPALKRTIIGANMKQYPVENIMHKRDRPNKRLSIVTTIGAGNKTEGDDEPIYVSFHINRINNGDGREIHSNQ